MEGRSSPIRSRKTDSKLPWNANNQKDSILKKLEQAKNSPRLVKLIDLDKDINYNSHFCTKGDLRGMMGLLEVDQTDLGRTAKKAAVVKHYRKYTSPMVDRCILHTDINRSSSPVAGSPRILDTDACMAANMNVPSTSRPRIFNSTPNSSTENLRTPCPVSKSMSKAGELREGLKKSVDKMVSRGFNKTTLIKLHSHVTSKQTKTSSPPITPGDLRRPERMSLEEMSQKDRDTIRKALHSHFPQLWIPINVAVSRPMLLALYNKFLLGNEERDLCQGVHYDIFPMTELDIDNFISFGEKQESSNNGKGKQRDS